MTFRARSVKGRWTATVVAIALVTAICMSSSATAGAIAASTKASFGSADISWGPVHTLYEHATRDRDVVTTDSGLVVAAWSASSSHSLFLSVRRGSGGWSDPAIVLPRGATSFQLAKDGETAVVVAQGFGKVSVVQIAGSGEIQRPLVIGSSSGSFTNGPVVGFGSDGSAAAVWKPTTQAEDVLLAYRSPSGEWQPQEPVPNVSGYPAGVVVDSAGTADIVYARADAGGGGLGLNLVERRADGSWIEPQSIDDRGQRPTMAANSSGDLVIAYDVGDETGATAYVRYRPSGADIGPAHLLDESATIFTDTPVAMADDGEAVATFGPAERGGSAELVRADSDGRWSAPEALSLRNYALATMNGAGDLTLYRGPKFIRCPADEACGTVETEPHGHGSVKGYTLGPRGAITVLTQLGCRFGGCGPFRLRVHRGR